MRRLHSVAALSALVVVLFMAITGAVLSIQPALEVASLPAAGTVSSVANLAAKTEAALPGVERITRSASGTVVAYYTEGNSHLAAQLDPTTGTPVGPYAPSGFFSFMTELHRSLFLGSNGHIASGIAALAILVISVSGLLLLVARAGGWRQVLSPSRGDGAGRLHSDFGRIAIVALVVTALSGAYMSAVNFGFVPDGTAAGFSLPPSSSGSTVAPVASLPALQAVSLADLRELVFPAAGDASDVFAITTSAGAGYVDQGTGNMLSFVANSPWQTIYEAFYTLHTGNGVWWLALVLGLGSLAVPALALTGTMIWWQRRSTRPHVEANAPARSADTVILVGSETGSTWGFAATLHAELLKAGHRVHLAAMNDVRPHYPAAQQLLVLTSTYGDGTAPMSAKRFLARLGRMTSAPTPHFAVLGFGDRSFPSYCQFAEDVEDQLIEMGMQPLLPLASVNRQSAQDFGAWGVDLGHVLGEPLTLVHVPSLPPTARIELLEREDYGIEVGAPTAVLRFRLPGRGDGRLDRFEPGDLVGIVPPDSLVPRYYSLASGTRDGVLEICVRKQQGGVCSEYLHSLVTGDHIEGFIRTNSQFRPRRGRSPVILVGAGAGMAPLVGFVRDNAHHRPVHVFLGARDPSSDFLYRETLEAAQADGRLSGLDAIFSRRVGGGYVQDRVLERSSEIRRLVADGAQILVCGSIDMALGVRQAVDDCLAPMGLSSDQLRRSGRYLEDAY